MADDPEVSTVPLSPGLESDVAAGVTEALQSVQGRAGSVLTRRAGGCNTYMYM